MKHNEFLVCYDGPRKIASQPPDSSPASGSGSGEGSEMGTSRGDRGGNSR